MTNARFKKVLLAAVLGATAVCANGFYPQVQAAPPAKAVPMVECWVLHQNSDFGPLVMNVSKNAMRMDIDKMGINWIARAPKWESHAFNPDSKSMVSRDYTDWKENLIRMPGSKKKAALNEFSLKSTGETEKISGYTCRKMAIYKTSSASDVKGRPGRPAPKMVPKGKPYPMGYVWIWDDFPAPRQVGEVMKQLTRVDVQKGMVLKATVLKPGAYKEYKPAFETLSIKKEKVPASLFEPPTGYKVVTSEIDLMMGSQEEEPPSLSTLKKRL